MPIDTPLTNLVAQLSRAGLRPEKRLVDQILAHGPAARGELLRLATKLDDLHSTDSIAATLGPLHALRLLGEVPDVAIIAPLLRNLPVEIYGDEDVPARLYGTELLQIVGRVGAPAIPVLLELAHDTAASDATRSAAVNALAFVAAYAPETREEVLGIARTLFADLSDPILATSAAATLADLGDRESYRAIMDAYRTKQLDQERAPAATVRKFLLSGGRQDLTCVKHPLWERYEHHGPFPAQQQAGR
jgi:hypothetical protein